MKYYKLTCEVPGQLGPETIFDKEQIPWTIKSLHLVMDGWLGGELMSLSSCLLVTANLEKALSFKFSGIKSYETINLEISEKFIANQGNVKLPKIRRIIIDSQGFIDDFALTYYDGLYNQLIISDKAKSLLDGFDLGNYSIELAPPV